MSRVKDISKEVSQNVLRSLEKVDEDKIECELAVRTDQSPQKIDSRHANLEWKVEKMKTLPKVIMVPFSYPDYPEDLVERWVNKSCDMLKWAFNLLQNACYKAAGVKRISHNWLSYDSWAYLLC